MNRSIVLSFETLPFIFFMCRNSLINNISHYFSIYFVFFLIESLYPIEKIEYIYVINETKIVMFLFEEIFVQNAYFLNEVKHFVPSSIIIIVTTSVI